MAPSLDLLACPACGAELRPAPGADDLHCSGCSRAFECGEGIPRLFWPEEPSAVADVTDVVKAFYERTPFPDYEELDTSASLKEKARRGAFARLLDEQIPDTARVLDVGCGTGQLGNFLALVPGRRVIATDMCLNSLRLAHAFKRRNGIENVTFAQMNLFRPALKSEAFDVVLCNGVLHHTAAPYRGLAGLRRLVSPGGFLVLGLYNSLGRLPTLVRRALLRIPGGRLVFLDPRLRSAEVGEGRKHSWFMDQYQHPHESRHSFGEVLGWFDACGLDFIGSIPRPRAFAEFQADESLFEPRPRGSALDHALVQLGMLFRGGREGGLFVMIGRRPA